MIQQLGAVLIYWFGYSIGYVKSMWKWCPWSPWTIAKLNMAWSHYIKTTMYEDRVALNKELKSIHGAEYKEDFSVSAFVNNREYAFFMRHVTKREWLKIIFTPFSCTGAFQLPTWRVKRWLQGEVE